MPAVPSISFTDNADGTATIHVSGSDVGSLNEVHTMRLDNQWPVNEWLLQADRTGDGSIDIEVGAGVFWVSVKSSLEDASSWAVPAYLHVTRGRTAMFDQVLAAVVARIRLIGLEDIDSSRVVDHMLLTPEFSKHVHESMILVAQWDSETPSNGGPTNRDRYGYQVVIAYLAPANQDQQSRRNRWNLWREQIRQAFNSQGLVTASGEVLTASYLKISGPIRAYWDRNLYASLMGFQFMSEEQRGMAT